MPPAPVPNEIVAQHICDGGQLCVPWHDTLKAGMPASTPGVPGAPPPEDEPALESCSGDGDRPASPAPRGFPTVAIPPHAVASAAPRETQERMLDSFI